MAGWVEKLKNSNPCLNFKWQRWTMYDIAFRRKETLTVRCNTDMSDLLNFVHNSQCVVSYCLIQIVLIETLSRKEAPHCNCFILVLCTKYFLSSFVSCCQQSHQCRCSHRLCRWYSSLRGVTSLKSTHISRIKSQHILSRSRKTITVFFPVTTRNHVPNYADCTSMTKWFMLPQVTHTDLLSNEKTSCWWHIGPNVIAEDVLQEGHAERKMHHCDLWYLEAKSRISRRPVAFVPFHCC